jgi:hypothetical protein
MYRSAVPFKRSLSLDEMKAATRYGLEEGLPRSEASLQRLGSVSQPGTLLGDLESQIQGALDSGQRGAQQVDLGAVTQPLQDAIKRASSDRTIEGRAYVQSLQQELTEWQQQYPQGLTVQEAQAAKRSLYDRINDSAYSDSSTAIPGSAREAKMQLAAGLRDAVNAKVPEVAALNAQMHTAIDLRDALTDAAKANPSGAGSLLGWALAGGAGASASTLAHFSGAGAGGAGIAGLISTATAHALASPLVRSRLAIAFRGSPQVARALSRAEQGAWAAAQGVQPQQ